MKTLGKRTGTMVLLTLLAAPSLPAADQLARLYTNGKLVLCRPEARVRAGAAYAPLRAAAEAVGAHVTWDAKSRMAVVCNDNQCVPLHARQGIMVNGSLLVPVRLLGEALGATVKWDAATASVRIKTKPKGLQ